MLFATRASAVVGAGLRRTPARASAAARWRRRSEPEANAGEAIDLGRVADHVGLSRFHFLWLFAGVLRVMPHQHLVRSRLHRVARLLAGSACTTSDAAFEAGSGDLSNFNRTFRRAVSVSSRAFRRMAKGDRNILQDRMAMPSLG